MAERKRSKDGKSETSQYREAGGGGGDAGRSGGNLARDIGTEDALKRAEEDRAGTTRVEKSDEHDRAEQRDSER